MKQSKAKKSRDAFLIMLAENTKIDAHTRWNDAVAIVGALGLQDLVILTNNPNKVAALKNAGLDVRQQPLVIVSNKFNEKYLATKEEKLGHSRGGK